MKWCTDPRPIHDKQLHQHRAALNSEEEKNKQCPKHKRSPAHSGASPNLFLQTHPPLDPTWQCHSLTWFSPGLALPCRAAGSSGARRRVQSPEERLRGGRPPCRATSSPWPSGPRATGRHRDHRGPAGSACPLTGGVTLLSRSPVKWWPYPVLFSVRDKSAISHVEWAMLFKLCLLV